MYLEGTLYPWISFLVRGNILLFMSGNDLTLIGIRSRLGYGMSYYEIVDINSPSLLSSCDLCMFSLMIKFILCFTFKMPMGWGHFQNLSSQT
jgi:hypothetical protein